MSQANLETETGKLLLEDGLASCWSGDQTLAHQFRPEPHDTRLTAWLPPLAGFTYAAMAGEGSLG